MTAALVSWLRKPDQTDGVFDDSVAQHPYPQLADMIENGEELGQKFMAGFLQDQYQNLCRLEDPQRLTVPRDQQPMFHYLDQDSYTYAELGALIRNGNDLGMKYCVDHYRIVLRTRQALKNRSQVSQPVV